MSGNSWIGSLNVSEFVKQQRSRADARYDLSMQDTLKNLSNQQNSLKLKQQIYNQVGTSLSQLQASISALQDAFEPVWQINSSENSCVSASVKGPTVPGSHSVSVSQLAQAESIASLSKFNSTSSSLGLSETISLSVGSGSPFSVTVDPNDSLQSIVNNINNTAVVNNAPISASVINMGGEYRLVISSTQTGLSQRVNISESGTSLIHISNDASANDGNEMTKAMNASFAFDGVDIVSDSNNYTINGINLNLLSATTAPVTLTLSQSSPVSAVANAMQAVITNYNQLVALLGQAEAQTAGAVNLSNILSTLKNDMCEVFSSDSQLNSLSKIGIQPELANAADMQATVTLANGQTASVYLSGLLRIVQESSLSDGTSLNDALTNNFSDVQTLLFDKKNGIFSRVKSQIATGSGELWRALSGPDAGSLQNTVTTQLTTLQNSLDDTNTRIAETKDRLREEYDNLESVLTDMQFTSFYISQFLEAMSSK